MKVEVDLEHLITLVVSELAPKMIEAHIKTCPVKGTVKLLNWKLLAAVALLGGGSGGLVTKLLGL